MTLPPPQKRCSRTYIAYAYLFFSRYAPTSFFNYARTSFFGVCTYVVFQQHDDNMTTRTFILLRPIETETHSHGKSATNCTEG